MNLRNYLNKVQLIICVFMSCAFISKAQLTGTYTIGGTGTTYPTAGYTNFASLDGTNGAFAALNSLGVGMGGATFNVQGGYTETVPGTLILTATGTVANPIVFQAAVSGVHPLIRSGAGGTAFAGMIVLKGSDYVTFDGIDLADANPSNATACGFGYGLFKASATNGAQHNTIKNCTISLRQGNYVRGGNRPAGSAGILVYNSNIAQPYTILSTTAASGTSSYNKFYANTVIGGNLGIGLLGYGAVCGDTVTNDKGNDIGGHSPATGNTILNFGGQDTVGIATGIHLDEQWDFNISYNTITSNTHTAIGPLSIQGGLSGGLINGISTWDAACANGNISYNSISLQSGTTGGCLLRGIDNEAGDNRGGQGINTINITHNRVHDCIAHSRNGAFSEIRNEVEVSYVNITDNIIENDTFTYYGNVGTCYHIRNNSSDLAGRILRNTIRNIYFAAPATLTLTAIYSSLSNTAAASSISDNWIENIQFANLAGSNSTVTLVSLAGSPLYDTINGNTLNNIHLNVTGLVVGFNNSISMAANGVKVVQHNRVLNGFSRRVHTNKDMSCYSDGASSPSTVRHIITDNNFSGIYSNSTKNLHVLISVDGGSGNPPPYLTAYNDTVTNDTLIDGNLGSFYGILLTGMHGSSTTPDLIHNNVVNNLYTDSSNVYGMVVGASGYYVNVYDNVVHSINIKGPGKVYGLMVGAGTYMAEIYRNKIYDLSGRHNQSTIYGLTIGVDASYINGGADGKWLVHDNLIGDLRHTAGYGMAIVGLFINCNLWTGTPDTGVYLYNNTVYLANHSSGNNPWTAALYAKCPSALLQMNNNILLINQTLPMAVLMLHFLPIII